MIKKTLRQQQINQLRQLEPLVKQREEASLYQQLWQLPVYQQATSIGLTVSSPIEVATPPLIERAWADGKTVYLPRTYPATHGMHFYRYQAGDKLPKSDFGIPEPLEDQELLDQLDLLIVPGLAYSPAGQRVGFGGGYYDRFLCEFDGATVVLALKAMYFPEPTWPVQDFDEAFGRLLVAE